MTESEDLEQETGAIEAIYPECIEKLADGIYRFKVPQHEHIIFQMSFPEHYPDEKPYILDVISEKEGFDEKYLMELFQEVLDSIYNEGSVLIFDLFTELDAVLYTGEDEEQEVLDNDEHWNIEDTDMNVVTEKLESSTIDNQSEEDSQSYEKYVYDENIEKAKMNTKKKSRESSKQVKEINPLDKWIISDPIIDRKSTFVAFAKKVNSLKEAEESVATLLEDKKCGRSTHAMRAWRIKDEETGAQYQDLDDDGETAAGGRMLHLMTVMNVWNVIVVCCRWFGGIHLGPDRFKHINNATRDALVKGGFVNVDTSEGKKSKKKK